MNKLLWEENFAFKVKPAKQKLGWQGDVCYNAQAKKNFKNGYLSLTLEQGSIISSLAAMRATQPSTTLFRYTNGVLPINFTIKIRTKDENEQQ